MSTPYERGQEHQKRYLDAWVQNGGTLQDACLQFGQDDYETLQEFYRYLDEDDRPESSKDIIRDNIEFYKGLLSVLD